MLLLDESAAIYSAMSRICPSVLDPSAAIPVPGTTVFVMILVIDIMHALLLSPVVSEFRFLARG